MTGTILVAILAATIVQGTPILFAALGELLTERAGVLNLGVEGMMLGGAVTGFLVAHNTDSAWLGVLAALVMGAAMAAIHAFLTVTLRANQVVSGLALTIFGSGLSAYIGKPVVGLPLAATFTPLAVPGLSQIPVLGQVLFQQDPLIYVSYVLVPLLWYWLYRTRPGLNLRAVGENPAAADAMGLSVYGIRYLYIMAGGALAGLAGAYLSLAVTPTWGEGMTAGRGWVAVALVIFATWNPAKALVGAYLFGGVEAMTFRMQALGITLSPHVLSMLPYLFTLGVLVVATWRARQGRLEFPGALGLAYDRETR